MRLLNWRTYLRALTGTFEKDYCIEDYDLITLSPYHGNDKDS